MTELRPTAPAGFLRPEASVGGASHHHTLHANVPVKEQEWHQHAAQYCAMGMKPGQVATACGVSKAQVQNLRNAPWFQERVRDLIKEQHVDIMDVLKRGQHEAVVRLVSLTTEAKSEAIQLAAINTVLDRIHGKATQKVEAVAPTNADPVARKAELEREIAELQKGKGDSSPASNP